MHATSLIATEEKSGIEKMNAMWISLKGNLKCGNKIADVATLPKKTANSTSTGTGTGTDIEKTKQDDEEGNSYNTNRFQELEIGEPSRNVVEMIFGASSTKPKRHSSKSKKIRRVLKVNNPADVVAKFENYREEVMMSSSKEHPRSTVDGNELLQFYGTTMSCCRVSQVCRNGGCRVCGIIQSGFNTYYNKLHGIRISSTSNRMSEDVDVGVAGKNAKKAVIICRMIGGGRIGGVGDSIVVPDPTALLPCFVVIFD